MTTAVTLLVLASGLWLLTPRGLAQLRTIALRRFFDRYLERPRHRVYDPRTDEGTDRGGPPSQPQRSEASIKE